MSYEVLWEPDGVVKRFHGCLSREDWLSAHRAVTEDPRLDSSKWVINDFSDVTSHNLTDDDLMTHTVESIGVSVYLPSIRGALVACSKPTLSLCRRIESPEYATPHESRIFQTMDEARAWLQG